MPDYQSKIKVFFRFAAQKREFLRLAGSGPCAFFAMRPMICPAETALYRVTSSGMSNRVTWTSTIISRVPRPRKVPLNGRMSP